MIKSILKNSLTWIIIIGCIGWAFGLTYTGFSIITETSINYGSYTWTFYKVDVHSYIKSIETSLTGVGIENIIPEMPTFTGAPDWANILSVVKFLVNTILIYVTNWIIYILDLIIVVPTQLILYPYNIILSLLGLNTADQSWINALKSIYNWQVPYIPYI